MRNRQYDAQLKIVIIGNSSVGKSSLLLRFADDTYNQNYIATIGVDFRFKALKLDDKQIKLQIWDTAGQQKFRTITSTYYKNSNAVLLVFDITSERSFQDLTKHWLTQVQNNVDQDTVLYLVGHKSDLQAQRTVSLQAVKAFTDQRKIQYFQTSAKTAANVRESFQRITRQLYQKSLKKQKKVHRNLKAPPTQSKGMCGMC